jgi:predicted nucleic acid-binding protein
LVLSNETLTEVAISLHRDYTEKEAEECLEEVRTRDMFKVVQTSSDRFDRAASHFIDICGKDPNFGEFIDYQLMADENIQYVSTWDSDFMSFEDISLLPVSRWER